jgi:hypothetical protein
VNDNMTLRSGKLHHGAALSIVAVLLVISSIWLGACAPSQPPPDGGDPAPGFTLPAAQGGQVSLSGLLAERRAAVLVFYRSYL